MNTLNGYSKSTLTDKYVLTASGGHRPLADSEFIVGTQTAATGSWTGVSIDSELYDGKQISYWLPYNGSGNATLNLTLAGGSTTGAIDCYYGGTSRLTTHYGAGNIIRLVYRENVTIGSTTIEKGWWADANYTDGNTYTSAWCGTAAATAAKTATCSNYTLKTNSYIHVLIRYTNTAASALTLNINSTGAKPIYINGVASSKDNYSLYAGTYIVFFNGTNYYFNTDSSLPGKIKDSSILWGTDSITGDISPIDSAASYLHSGNKLQFADPKGITIEYSTNKGSTWIDYGTTDVNKIGLVSSLYYAEYIIGKGLSTKALESDQLRITLHATNMGVYTRAKSLLVDLSTNGSASCKVKVETATKGNPTSFSTRGEYPVEGWSGWNRIPLNNMTFGGGASQTSHIEIIRLTFTTTGTTKETGGHLRVLSLLLLGVTNWTTPSNMAKTGHLYRWDSSQNAIFPAQVTATQFNGLLNGNASSATKLATKRKLWGQDFDGTADVSGSLTGVSNLTASGQITAGVFYGKGSLGGAALYAGHREGLALGIEPYDKDGNWLNVGIQLFQDGNVSIGTTTNYEKLYVNGNVKATSFIGNLDGTYVNKLTGYSKATSASDLAATDKLNTALGKLEYKAHYAYDWVVGVTATDTDEYINKWSEIVDFIDSVKEGTDILDEFVTTKTDQIITGQKNFNTNTNSAPLVLSRSGLNTKECVSIGVDDGTVVFNHIQDEKTANYTFKGTWLDTENSDGSKAGNHAVYFNLGNSYASIKLDSYTVYHTGNLTRLSQLENNCNFVTGGPYLPLAGGVMNNGAKITFNANGSIEQTTATTSNATRLVQWYKGTSKDPDYTNAATIGWHNMGDTDGAIYLVPHPSNTDPWAGSVGLYIGKNTLKWNNNNLLKAIKSITRSGTTFTYTCLDGTTGTFTQQDNNTTYSFSGGVDKFTVTPSSGSAIDVSVGTLLVNGTYTSNGGEQRPSYIESGKVRWNMMRATTTYFDSSPFSGYCDWMMMDTYTGSDVPYVTMIGVLKSATPHAYIASGAKGDSSGKWTIKKLLDSGNSSVSGGGSSWGSSITVKINGTTKTLTIPAKPTIPTVTDYYWANIKVSETESTTTTPTFGSTVTLNSTGNVILNLTRTSESSWRFLNDANLRIQNNYTSDVVDYFDVVKIAYNTGNVTLKGSLTASSSSNTVGIPLVLKNTGWKGGMSTAIDFYNGSNYTVPNARIATKMIGGGASGGTLIFYTQTAHATTNPNPNGLTERLRVGDDGIITVSGQIIRSSGGSWIKARDNAIINQTYYASSAYMPSVAMKSASGYWSIGTLGSSLVASYDTDTNYNAGTNSNTAIYFPTSGGTLALTSQIPSLTNYYTKTESDSRFYGATISRTANTVLAAPDGGAGVASFRKLVVADMPDGVFKHLGTENKASVWSWGTVSGTSGWSTTASDRGYRNQYGTNLDISGFSTWYHRFAMCTDGRIEYWHGINTKTLTKLGTIAWTSEIPTKVSQLENDSNFITSRGYIGTTSVQASSGNQALTGINNITTPSYGFTITTPSGNIQIGPQNTSGCHIYTNKDLFYFNKPIYYWDGSSSHVYISEYNYTSYTPILNSSSTHATKSSVIYAPTSAGTSGQILQSTGETPTWVDQSTLTAGKVSCTATSYNVTRPIVLTNTSNSLYYTTKATINYSTGYVTAPKFIGDLQGTAGKVTCVEGGVNAERYLICTSGNNLLYYAKKCTVNYDLGTITASGGFKGKADYATTAESAGIAGYANQAGSADYATTAERCSHGTFGNAATKSYTSTVSSTSDALITSNGVDTALEKYLPLSGGTMTGTITSSTSTIIDTYVDTSQYVILQNHNNGNVSLSARGEGLYLGYYNTKTIYCRGSYVNIDSGNWNQYISVSEGTTYSAGVGLSLNGTTFNIDAGDEFPEGTSNFTAGTEILTSYASDTGFTTTNYKGVYRRKASSMYNYIKNNLDSVYLPLTGGTLYNANNMNPLSINSDSGESGIKFQIAYANKGWVGYNTNYGISLYNYARGKYLNYKDDGTLQFEGNEVLHSGNWSNYITLPTTPSGGYIGTTAVQSTSQTQNLTGIGGITANSTIQTTGSLKGLYAYVNSIYGNTSTGMQISATSSIDLSAGDNAQIYISNAMRAIYTTRTTPASLGLSNAPWGALYAASGTFTGNISANGGSFYTNANGAYHTSDIRKKTNITKARNLSIADLLVEFDWKESNEHSWGYIAQDLLEVLPEAVDYNEDIDVYSVNYNVAHSAAIASLTARIKELEEKLKKYGIQ